MKRLLSWVLLFWWSILHIGSLYGQQPLRVPNRFDFGKMWTFEHPPVKYFEQTYGYRLDTAWFNRARLGALRFARWCSASFVSPDGLIMTNHHCSRSLMGDLMREGENFDSTGFYARTRAEERKKEGLYVEQLVKIEDITDRVLHAVKDIDDPTERQNRIRQTLQLIKEEYAQRNDWKDLRLQTVTYYSGGKFSLYGYKRYDDIRLVMIPELSVAYFGGDDDNFTYPRYNLDVTFWRAYDKEGKPLNTSDFYFPFNPNGITEGTPVFVIGNPARTERYRSYAQLLFDRDYRYPMQLTFLRNRHKLLAEQHAKHPSHALQEMLFSIANSIKAINGILNGLKNDTLLQRKYHMEQYIRSHTPKDQQYIWEELAKYYRELAPYAMAANIMGPNQLRGKAVNIAFNLYRYYKELEKDTPDQATLVALKEEILQLSDSLYTESEWKYLKTYLDEIQRFDHPQHPIAPDILKGKNTNFVAHQILKNTNLKDPEGATEFLNMPLKKWKSSKDPLWKLAQVIAPAHEEALDKFSSTSPRRKQLEQQIALAVFEVLGDDLPPDATFTLRIADGVVKGYHYNGTRAPYKTTYYGMYDRHYSFDGQFPWDLPARWHNPPYELLQSPLNFVSTNDIIGGNSGSPIINVHHQVVGLVFDGNIESLPGNFIFDETYNRTVAVHAGGIIAALKYIYRADALVNELLQDYYKSYQKNLQK